MYGISKFTILYPVRISGSTYNTKSLQAVNNFSSLSKQFT